MEGWIVFWQVALYVAVALFTVLSLWVIVAGWGDIKRMFAELRSEE